MKKKVKKVMKFAQSESRAKQFRHDYPITDELKQVLLTEVFRDFTKYVVERYYSTYTSMLEEFVEGHFPRKEKRESLELNLFWWQIYYHANQNNMSCVEDYIADNYHDLSNKPLITSWLREWDKAVPKFYHVGYKYNDRVFVVTDLLTAKTLDVIVYAPYAVPPKKGEIVMGTLLPIGDALYFPIIDFYHFDFEAREEIARHIIHYYQKHLKTTTMHEAFIHVLSAVLHVERIVHSENH